MAVKFSYGEWYYTQKHENLFHLTPDERSWYKLIIHYAD